jgi:AcrR family transcriptional regulator
MATLDTKERIKQAALKLFSTKGFLGATTKEIAKEARVAEVTLFRYFSSKENLFEEVLRDYSFLSELRRILEHVKDMRFEEALHLIAKRFLEALKARKDIIRIIQSEVYRYPDKVQVIYHRMIDGFIQTIADYLKGLKEQGITKDLDDVYTARAFMGFIFSLFNMQEILMRSRYKKDNEQALLAAYVDIFIRGIKR